MVPGACDYRKRSRAPSCDDFTRGSEPHHGSAARNHEARCGAYLKGLVAVMQLDDWDTCDLDALERIRWMSMIGHRISAIERRFPLASRGLLSILDQAIFSGTSFITAVVIGRTTSPDSLGIFYLVLSVILIVSGVQDQVVASPYDVYSKRRHGRELVEFAGSIWAHHFAITAIAVLSLLIAACAL